MYIICIQQKTYLYSGLSGIHEVKEMAEQVAELANVSLETAQETLLKYKEVWLAVDALLVRPVTKGDKYIPTKPKVDVGMTEEQRLRCEKGRWLQDQVNAVFSVAHSKIRTQPEMVPETSQLANLPEVVPETSSPAEQKHES